MERYLVGSADYLANVRAALDVLAGLPRRTAMPSPPASATYYDGAIGWVGHLLAPPERVSDEVSLLRITSDADPYLGETATVDGQLVTVPDEPLERHELSADVQAYLDQRPQV